ncbi:MAG: DNA-directed RNA polymerase subunit omega [Bacteroidaceae bacterium]|nr:DNA-directed RNA polymerase subunit omega [Bacteroidaceae bacterium]
MDYKKSNAPTNTVTRDMISLSEDTGNVYETVSIIAKRANQIAREMKEELDNKLEEFAASSDKDNMEEENENREQIEVSRYYEKLPKPTLIATQEYIEGRVYHRNPEKDKNIADDLD